MTSIISTAVLRAAVLSAFDRGRYKVQFGTAPAGDDIAVVPASICLDLGERDDDLMFFEKNGIITAEERLEIADFIEGHGADDHGLAVPAQDGHGCRGEDVSARLRGRRVAMAARAQGESDALSDAVKAALGDDPAMRRAAVEAGYASLEDYVAAPAPVTPPAPGPLTSAEGLLRGDVLRVIWSAKYGAMGELQDGGLAVLCGRNGKRGVVTIHPGSTDERCWDVDRFAFVGRPDADGWMDWPGGDNPVPGRSVFTMTAAHHPVKNASEDLDWRADFSNPIRRFRLVDLPALPSDT